PCEFSSNRPARLREYVTMPAFRLLDLGLALGMILLQPGVQTEHTAAGEESAPAAEPKPAPPLPTGGAAKPENVAMSEDGKLPATVSDDTAILWEACTGKQLATYMGHTATLAR